MDGSGSWSSLTCSATSALLCFVLPLVCVNWIKDLAEQVVDAGIVRSESSSAEDASRTLASFGICWYICTLFTAICGTAQQATLVLGAAPTGRRNVVRLYGLFAAFAGLAFISIGLLPAVSNMVFVELHEVTDERTLVTAKAMIVLMAGFPLLEMVKKYYSGVLSRHKKTFWITVGALANVGGIFVSITILINIHPEQGILSADSAAWLPVAGLYTGGLCDTAVVFTAARRCSAAAATAAAASSKPPAVDNETLWRVVRFSWPLALRELTMGLSRPLINLWVARDGVTGTEELAVLIVVCERHPPPSPSCSLFSQFRLPSCAFHTETLTISVCHAWLLPPPPPCHPLAACTRRSVHSRCVRLAERAQESRSGV